ncbi:MAG TPA: hypothetical protein VMU54_11185 [Planctomycetota bacterium]|jgi:hypothetical protein|nr:hypothetical protein [Planctomycetota bacterium]HVR84866.1 hypothetical protein [Planctomycetota bacterium]
MNGVSYLLLFFPIVLVILVVLEAARSDDPKSILKRALANLGVLTAVLVLGGAFVYVINRWF